MSDWRQVVRRVRQPVVGSSIVVGLLLLLVIAVNAVDEDLSRQSIALLTPPPNPYPDRDNLYVAIMGFDAPADQTPARLGAARINYYNETIATRLLNPGFGNDGPLASPAGTLEFRGKSGKCRSLQESVWKSVREQQSDIASDWQANRVLMERYGQLHALKGYYETARPSVLMRVAILPSNVRCLFLKKLALELQSDEADRVRQGVEELAADIRMSQQLINGNGTLISRMIGATYMQADQILLSDAVANPGTDVSAMQKQEPALFEPYPIGSWQIGSAFAGELRFAQSAYRMAAMSRGTLFDRSADSTWWDRLGARIQSSLFKLHATTNLEADLTGRLMDVADGDPSMFSTRRDELERWTKEQSRLSIRWVSNPVGKTLVWESLPAYLDYPARVYDIAAFQRLVCLAFQIRQQKIGPESVATFMRQHPELSTHPIGNVPFEWDAKSSRISVKTVGPRPAERRFSVSVAG